MQKIVLQGLPGIGKTSLVQKLSAKLIAAGVEVSGFYTEEVRNSQNQRVGFDVTTFDGKKGTLARKGAEKTYKVGVYGVFLEDFESIALPVLQNLKTVLVVDEIGKMELFSRKFQQEIEVILANRDLMVIATVPLKGGPILVKKIKEDPGINLITVTASNRDSLVEELVSSITKSLSS